MPKGWSAAALTLARAAGGTGCTTDDGGLRRATAITVGRFRLLLGPPEGGAGDPYEGTLSVEVRSSVTRAG